MQAAEAPLPGLIVITTRVFADARGAFREVWKGREYAEAGVPDAFVQDNASTSTRGVLRGVHLQDPYPQGKLVSALHGEIWDVAVDLRPGSDHFGRWFGTTLSSENGVQLYIPPGFGHGFVVTSGVAVVSYKCTEVHHPECEHTIRWDDPELGIEWPVRDPILSAKDRLGTPLRDWRRSAPGE